MACANIEEDHDIVKFATIHTKARFNLASFMEEVQAIMGVPEWYIFTDSRHTKQLHAGRCLQIQVRHPRSLFDLCYSFLHKKAFMQETQFIPKPGNSY
jgi:hypothetical protein